MTPEGQRARWAVLGALATLVLATLALPAAAADPPASQPYIVQRRDSLIGIGQALLERPADWRIVQSLNAIGKRGVIHPGQTLQIPLPLLKSEPGVATAAVVTGKATIDGKPLAAGQSVAEAAEIVTEADAVIVLRLSDGSTLNVAPASRLRFDRLRRYHSDDIVEARIRLERGRVETSATAQRVKPVEIRTPLATAAVRGTTFRVGAEPAYATTEVLTGAVDWGSQTNKIDVPTGFGSSADPQSRVTPAEPLLPAPSLVTLPARLETPAAEFRFAPVAQASAYRIQVAVDEAFTSIVSEQVASEPRGRFDSRADGIHYVRARAIAASKVEGLDGVGRIDIQARPAPPLPVQPRTGTVVFDPVVSLQWTVPAGIGSFRVQLAGDAGFTRILSDERVQQASASVNLQIVPPAAQSRYWRVASIDDSGKTGPFSAIGQLEWRATPPVPAASASAVVTSGRMVVRWTQVPGERYLVEASRDAAFSRIEQRVQTSQGEAELKDLTPGRYFVRLQATAPDGVVSPYSATQSIDIKPAVGSGVGSPLQSGFGTIIESPRQ